MRQDQGRAGLGRIKRESKRERKLIKPRTPLRETSTPLLEVLTLAQIHHPAILLFRTVRVTEIMSTEREVHSLDFDDDSDTEGTDYDYEELAPPTRQKREMTLRIWTE